MSKPYERAAAIELLRLGASSNGALVLKRIAHRPTGVREAVKLAVELQKRPIMTAKTPTSGRLSRLRNRSRTDSFHHSGDFDDGADDWVDSDASEDEDEEEEEPGSDVGKSIRKIAADLNRVSDLFKLYDVDASGALDRDELKLMLSQLGVQVQIQM